MVAIDKRKAISYASHRGQTRLQNSKPRHKQGFMLSERLERWIPGECWPVMGDAYHQ